MPTTQRAYTLRLNRGSWHCAICEEADCACWRESLWATHEAVNKGAKVFGDWLLTLRVGLCHTLADMDVPAKGKNAARKPTDEERRDRRILLALSWLSVEDERGAPQGYGLRVATGNDSATARGEAVKAALREILHGRGAKEAEINDWLTDCEASLEASVREDAVWVNRSRAFDDACRRWHSLDRASARAVLAEFFGNTGEYLSLPAAPGGDDDEAPVAVGRDQDVEFRNIARGWVSFNLGTGEKSDYAVIAEWLAALAKMEFGRFAEAKGSELATAIAGKVKAAVTDNYIDATLDSIRAAVGWKGRPSKGRDAIETACRKTRLAKADLETLATKLGEEAKDKKEDAGRHMPSWVKDFKDGIEAVIGFKFVTERDLTGEYSTMLDHAARRVSIGH